MNEQLAICTMLCNNSNVTINSLPSITVRGNMVTRYQYTYTGKRHYLGIICDTPFEALKDFISDIEHILYMEEMNEQ